MIYGALNSIIIISMWPFRAEASVYGYNVMFHDDDDDDGEFWMKIRL